MEIWKDIPGFEGKYQVSDMGRLKSLDRLSKGRHLKGKLLTGQIGDKQGHRSVRLDDRKQHYIHRLVMLTFVRAPKNKEDVRHLNGIPFDNRLINLKYGSRTDNNLDVYKYNKKFKVFSIEDVKSIRLKILEGCSQKEIAHFYGVSYHAISKINTGKTFGWVK